MQKVVLDTDIIIDYTRNASLLFEILLEQYSHKKLKLFIPSVVVAELISGQETKHDARMDELEKLIAKLEFVPLDYNISKAAGMLVRDKKPRALADAVVAATALSLNAKLATRNTKDFEGIQGLKFFKSK